MAKNEKDGKNGKNENGSSGDGDGIERLLPPRGDYHTLLGFKKAEVVFDITFHFVPKFLSQGDRTIDQMIQAARSGKKNILEGSKAGRASKETELKLTNVARASLEELLDDYEDYLSRVACRFGTRIPKRPFMSASSEGKRRLAMRTFVISWKLGQRLW